MKKFYMIYREGNQSATKKHDTLKEANVECHRLCNKHPNENFYILQAICMSCGSVEVKGCDLV